MPRPPQLRSCAVTLIAATAMAAGCRPAPPAPPVPPPAVRLAPATARYALVEHRHVEQQYLGQPIVTDALTRAVLSVAIDTTPAGFSVDAVVDSVAVAGAAGVSPEALRAASGSRFRADLSAEGVVRAVQGPRDGNPIVDYLALRMQELVPRLPRDGAAPGARWHDSIQMRGQTAGIPITVDTRDHHAGAADWTEHAGRPVLPVETDGEYTLSGEGERTGQWVIMTGSGTSHRRRLLTRDGMVALETRIDTIRITMELPGSGLRIPLIQVRTDTLRRVDR